jgi:hypothetical protein
MTPVVPLPNRDRGPRLIRENLLDRAHHLSLPKLYGARSASAVGFVSQAVPVGFVSQAADVRFGSKVVPVGFVSQTTSI